MFCVIYIFQVKPGKNHDFERTWSELTDALYRHAGSLGSKLHKSGEDRYMAYATWPNQQSWENSTEKLPAWALAIRDRMKESCLFVETVFAGNVLKDLTKTGLL